MSSTHKPNVKASGYSHKYFPMNHGRPNTNALRPFLVLLALVRSTRAAG